MARELLIDRTARSLPAEQFAEFRRLAREIEAHAGRWGLFLLQYEHENERQSVGRAIDALCQRPVQVTASAERFAQWVDLEAELARVAQGADLIQIVGLDAWLDDRSDRSRTESLLRAWNVRRDGFARDVPVPVLCWLRAATLKQLARLAPDLWSWRAGVHSFATQRGSDEPATGQVRAMAAQTDLIDNRTVGQRTRRLRDIRQYLDATAPADEMALALRGALLDELASLHDLLGQLDEALRIRVEEQLPVYERLGDVRAKAITQSKIADILQARGQLDEALRIRVEEELPVYERLGDVHSKAVTQGQIADILQERGQLDEALRIRVEEELPVYERLGDVRSKAVTQGRIAAILQVRGQLDEALALHAQRLPVAERMGDQDSVAHIKWAIAALRLQRGDHRTEGLQAIHNDLAEAFAISRQLGRPDFIGGIGTLLAQVLKADSRPDEALPVLDAAEAAYVTLGDTAGVAQVRTLRDGIAPNA